MNNKNTFKILALVALLAYVISPVDALPGPADDIIRTAGSAAAKNLTTKARFRAGCRGRPLTNITLDTQVPDDIDKTAPAQR